MIDLPLFTCEMVSGQDEVLLHESVVVVVVVVVAHSMSLSILALAD